MKNDMRPAHRNAFPYAEMILKTQDFDQKRYSYRALESNEMSPQSYTTFDNVKMIQTYQTDNREVRPVKRSKESRDRSLNLKN